MKKGALAVAAVAALLLFLAGAGYSQTGTGDSPESHHPATGGTPSQGEQQGAPGGTVCSQQGPGGMMNGGMMGNSMGTMTGGMMPMMHGGHGKANGMMGGRSFCNSTSTPSG